MKIGFIGLPNSGKTTIFNALTKSKAEITAYANTRGEPNLAVVEVIDERVTRLAEIYRPKKTTYAAIEFIDFAGLSEGSGKGDAFSGTAMGLIKGRRPGPGDPQLSGRSDGDAFTPPGHGSDRSGDARLRSLHRGEAAGADRAVLPARPEDRGPADGREGPAQNISPPERQPAGPDHGTER